MGRFSGKVVFITGGASGIGMASAQRMGAEGAKVFIVDINKDSLKQATQQLRHNDINVVSAVCDVTQEAQVQSAINACIESFGKLDVLCNMAGILRFDHFHEIDFEEWRALFDINVGGVFLTCKLAMPYLLETQGNIVNAASTAALAGLPYGTLYSATKGAVLSLTQGLAVEYASQGLRANCVSPADIKTPMTKAPAFPDGADLSLMARCTSMTGAKGPEVVAGVIAMLASDDGCHISGENIRVDGACMA